MHSLGLDTDSDGDCESSSSVEDEWQVNAVDIVQRDSVMSCKTCKSFHESLLTCGHVIPLVVNQANAVKVTEGKLKLHPGRVNGKRIKLLRDTGATLIGVNKDLVSENDLTGEHVICRTFGGTTEKYPLAWIDINSPFLC